MDVLSPEAEYAMPEHDIDFPPDPCALTTDVCPPESTEIALMVCVPAPLSMSCSAKRIDLGRPHERECVPVGGRGVGEAVMEVGN